MLDFKILHKGKKSKARIGNLKTNHGEICTPAFVAVGTCASVKSLTPEEISASLTQLFFVNTYHLYLRPGEKIIQDTGGVHNFMNWQKPLMSDSGGFQVFSLARAKKDLIVISNEGVHFRSHLDGSKHFFTPEKSIAFQHSLGTDLMISFDDCTPYPVTFEKAKLSLSRTNRWAERSLDYHRKSQSSQALYGVIQGSIFNDLRVSSAKYIREMDFSGIAIGGVSVGESKGEMRNVCDWVIPLLPEEKPRHLLGVGEIDDIFSIIKRGVDTFDCIMPTHLARRGIILTRNTPGYRYDIKKPIYADNFDCLENNCQCYACKNFTKAYINHLFRANELLAYRLATIHNLYFVNKLVEQIRKAIEEDKFEELEKEWTR